MPDSAIVSQPSRLMDDIISSYEDRIAGVQSIFDTTRLVLTDFQDGSDQAREEQTLINTQLRETLARNENLRNKDYDLMMRPIVEPRRAQEKEIRALLNEFLAEQQRLAADLKEHYVQLRLQLAQGDPHKIRTQLNAVKELLKEQDRKKEELTASLKEVQEERHEMVMLVKQLLVKGNALRIRDFKDILARIKSQGQERIARKLKRREEVRQLLANFKQKRLDNLEEQRLLASPPPACQSFGKKGATSSRHGGITTSPRQVGASGPLASDGGGRLPLGGDVRMKEALEAIQWSQHPQGGEQTKNMVQAQAG